MDTNNNKHLEEYIKQLLKNYSVPYTEEEKNAIIREFENTKHHSSNFNISFKETIQNKTLLFIIIIILSMAALIYILTKIFPANSSDYHSNTTSAASDTIGIQVDTAISVFTPSNNVHSVFTTPNTVQNNTSVAVNTVTPSPTSSSNTTTGLPSSNKDNPVNTFNPNAQKTDTLQSSSNSTTNNNIPEKPIKKKKKKKSNADNHNDTQDNTLPVLEPKTPDINNNNVKEEE